MIAQPDTGLGRETRPARRTDTSRASRQDRGTLRLPAYGGRRLGYLRSDDFGRSVLWVDDAHVYTHLGRPSLSFVFPGGRDTRHTARIATCEKFALRPGLLVRFFLGAVDVSWKGAEMSLPVWFAASPVAGAPLLLSSADHARLCLAADGRDPGRLV